MFLFTLWARNVIPRYRCNEKSERSGRLEGTNQFTKQKQKLGPIFQNEMNVSDIKKEASKQSLFGSLILTIILILIVYLL